MEAQPHADWDSASDRDWADVLSSLPLFAEVPKRHLRKLAAKAEVREFAAGEAVVATGVPPDWFYVILGGEAKASGRPAARELGPGDYFGEIALLDREPRSASVVASNDLHVMRLPRNAFLELLEKPGVAAKMLSELGARVRQLEQL